MKRERIHRTLPRHYSRLARLARLIALLIANRAVYAATYSIDELILSDQRAPLDVTRVFGRTSRDYVLDEDVQARLAAVETRRRRDGRKTALLRAAGARGIHKYVREPRRDRRRPCSPALIKFRRYFIPFLFTSIRLMLT